MSEEHEVHFSEGTRNTYIAIAMVGVMVALTLNIYNMTRINEVAAAVLVS